ncbi:TIR domain-containing protein [Phycicoccus jejuensis]|uniref:TIR domain-containing protein n=1 Tax=Phycicoccus jejuensis TaxID=367299 RepID=UPI00385175AB
MGAIAGQEILPAQNWEAVKKQGDAAVHQWIDKEMARKAAVVVLIGSETASRKFVKYEIRKAWDTRKPLLGIRIHGLLDSNQRPSTAGTNPFSLFGFSDSTKTFADFVPVFTPSGQDSKQVYASIEANLDSWIAKGYKRP